MVAYWVSLITQLENFYRGFWTPFPAPPDPGKKETAGPTTHRA